MPEGDTVFRAARTLQKALAGRTVTRFESMLPQLTRVDDDTPLAGRRVERVWSQGKHLLMAFSGDLVLRTHMRMNGSWHVYRPGEPWQRPRREMRVVLETDAFVAVAFSVPVAEFSTAGEAARDLRPLGPDLLDSGFDAAEAARRLRGAAMASIGDALLDQRLIAGAGNVYKSEVCFLCGVDPFAPVGDLTDDQIDAVIRTARTLLLANTAPASGAGIVTYHGLRRTTGRANPAERLWVYGRRGRPCRRCGTPIRSRKQGPDARTTYWCPVCQPPVGEPGGRIDA
jgi:endonuclease VIII